MSKAIAANISVLAMLTAEGTKDDVFEFRVVDNSVARVNTSNADFKTALASWVSQAEVQRFLADPDVGRIAIVAGVVQKYVSKKIFQKYTGKAEGNGWGVNVGGQLFLSSSNYSLDVLYGLDLLAYREVSTVQEAEATLSKAGRKITSPEFEDLRSMVATNLSKQKMFMRAFSHDSR